MNKKVIIIGAGIGGLSAASYLAKKGFNVTILEKNSWVGGRAQVWEKQGFTFDLGPTWYWMPEIFEQFYNNFGHKTSDFYTLKRLDPSYRIYFEDEYIDLPANKIEMCQLFESYEKGTGDKLNRLLKQTEKVYATTMKTFIPNSFDSYSHLFNKSVFNGGLEIFSQYNGLQSVERYLSKDFKNEKLLKILQFPFFFLGASVADIPSVYAIMNHIDIQLGTWYPMGGFRVVAQAFYKIAKEQNVQILLNQEIVKIHTNSQDSKSTIKYIKTKNQKFTADFIISNADYYHTEMLLDPEVRSYSEKYWNKKKLAPSAVTIYLGLNKRLPGIKHHTLFFHNNWNSHTDVLFRKHTFPEKPLYYISCPSKTDISVSPPKNDALIILIPIAAGLNDSEIIREKLYNEVISDLEEKIHTNIKQSIIVKRIYSLNDFISDYNAFKGNAYGLAQTTLQTAIFRPRISSKKIKNLYYTGHFTVPGIGLPMVAISGKIVADEIQKHYGI